MQTCQFITEALPDVPCTFEASIRERSLGVLEGLLRKEAAEQKPEALALLRKGSVDDRVPGLHHNTTSKPASINALLSHQSAPMSAS